MGTISYVNKLKTDRDTEEELGYIDVDLLGYYLLI
jgi:hypothetical protein